MSKAIHKGTELNNVSETWEQNERLRNSAGEPASRSGEESTPRTELDEVIKKEAVEYDNENKETRLLSGDRASLNDDHLMDDES
ncbi:MAG TPA: hypothetical protein VEZ55_15460 [Chitinophagaceae bacterium]|nr:hypothetical protein [Chitinophagaceae bacterium]